MKEIRVVPKPIIDTLETLKPTRTYLGYRIRENDEYDRSFHPPDFMKNLWFKYFNEYDNKATFLIPKMYLLMYRAVLKIPTLRQTLSVFNNDKNLQKACCFVGFYKRGDYQKSVNKKEMSSRLQNIGMQGLLRLHNELLQLSKEYRESLHNLADELDYKKLTIDGLVPSIWVKYYRIHKIPETIISEKEFEAVFANNTGVEVIDDLTRNLPLSYRSDVRQDTALRCFELNIDIDNTDAIAEITRKVTRKYRNEEMRRRYGERSLFSKPFKDSEVELWQTIVDPSADIEVELENQEIIRRHELNIIQSR